MVPSMLDGLPPVTRLRILLTVLGPVKVALSPRDRLKLAKAMKQIRSPHLPHAVRHRIVRPRERPTGADTPVQGNLRPGLSTPQAEAEEQDHGRVEQSPESRQHSACRVEDHQ